jgi:hypothetical protein
MYEANAGIVDLHRPHPNLVGLKVWLTGPCRIFLAVIDISVL